MEQKRMISDDLLNSAPLEHHGIKGMKWGVWNSETRAKYLGGVKKFAKKKVSEVKESYEAKEKERAETKAAKKQAREDIKAQRKELGMSRAKYNELRETTLKSHDPKVVARGMQTLTDDELDKKLDRLKKEDQIARLSSDQATRKHQEHKARSEAIKANPLYGISLNVAGKALKKASNGVVDVSADKDRKKKNDPAASNNDTSGKSRDKQQSFTNPFTKRNPAPYSAASYEKVRKVVKNNPVSTEYVSSSAARSAATRGKRLISDGTVKAEVIDVTPVSASSARSEVRKALPNGRG
jgi:hypothetical protein